jgi:hypothetical protein
MKVLPSQTGEAAAQRLAATRTENADASTFKAALAQASTDATAPGTDVTLRKGETMKAVEGHAYAEITSGKRSGMFVNTSGNVRHGEAFVRVLRDGKEYHIYGSGKDRLVVGFHIPQDKVDAGADSGSGTGTGTGTGTVDTTGLKLRKGEKVEPVEGHGYAEITSGPRSGMFINTSGNARHGDAFVLVQKNGIDYHIYGSGKDREVVGVRSDDDDDK